MSQTLLNTAILSIAAGLILLAASFVAYAIWHRRDARDIAEYAREKKEKRKKSE